MGVRLNFVLLALPGCFVTQDKLVDWLAEADTAGWDTSGGEETDSSGGNPRFLVTLNATTLTVRINGGTAATYSLGVAETTNGSSDPWTFEDCYHGYTSPADNHWEPICHPLSATGGSFESIYGEVSGTDIFELDPTTQTLFSTEIPDLQYAVYIASGAGDECWTINDAGSGYFDALGCTPAD